MQTKCKFFKLRTLTDYVLPSNKVCAGQVISCLWLSIPFFFFNPPLLLDSSVLQCQCTQENLQILIYLNWYNADIAAYLLNVVCNTDLTYDQICFWQQSVCYVHLQLLFELPLFTITAMPCYCNHLLLVYTSLLEVALASFFFLNISTYIFLGLLSPFLSKKYWL